jgi:hypothetical protein
MTNIVNIENTDVPFNAQQFNMHVDVLGNLNFNANGLDGAGDRRLSINDDNGQVTVGGGGQFGALQLNNPASGNTIFVGVDAPTSEARAFLGGGNSQQNGRVLLGNSAAASTIDMRGSNGSIRCVSLTETSDARLKRNVAPLQGTLERIGALRGVRYQWKREDCSESECSEGFEIGFVGQEVATIYPELVTTDAVGYTSISYSRLTAILVEAIKEQQQMIQQLSTELVEALQRIARVEIASEPQGS